MVFWNGACIVHDEFKAFELEALKKEHPKAKVLVHPESPADVIALADAVGSTSAILKAAREMDATGVHRRHRQRHDAQAAHAEPRQDLL
jgi:quinolinate synthase